jgi:hypothetical protein
MSKTITIDLKALQDNCPTHPDRSDMNKFSRVG